MITEEKLKKYVSAISLYDTDGGGWMKLNIYWFRRSKKIHDLKYAAAESINTVALLGLSLIL